jgi:hypothetical protein
MKFDILVFFENLPRKFKFHYNLTRITGTVHGDRYCTWRPVLYMETGAVHGDRYCTWRPVLYMETGAVHGDRCCTWRPVLYMETDIHFRSYIVSTFLE